MDALHQVIYEDFDTDQSRCPIASRHRIALLKEPYSALIQKVGADIDRSSLNTAVSEMMIFVNEASKQGRVTHETLSTLTRVIAPLAPHVAEELWEKLGNQGFVLNASWPDFDPAIAAAARVSVTYR